MKIEELPKAVINLPHRQDRLNKFKKEMATVGLHGIMLQPGIIDAKVSKGISMSHLAAMELCFKKGDYALVMEDDVWFPGRHKTIARMNECLANAPAEWDILLGGLYKQEHHSKHNEYWNSVPIFNGLHFYIINKKAFERIKKEIKHTDHIDKWISEKKFNVYVMNPMCAMQYDGYSDNVKYETKYNKLYLKRFNIFKP